MSWRYVFNRLAERYGFVVQDVLNMTPYQLVMYWKTAEECDPFGKMKGKDEQTSFERAVANQKSALHRKLLERMIRG